MVKRRTSGQEPRRARLAPARTVVGGGGRSVQLDRVLDEIGEAPGIVLFTLLEKDLVARLEDKCKQINVPSLSIIGPVMQLFEAYLGAATTGRVGAQHVLNAEYFKRIDALNYTMIHDDGQHVEGLDEADGVSLPWGVGHSSKVARRTRWEVVARAGRSRRSVGLV